jgi:uncharacterized protein (TIGR00730 family)
MSLSICVFCGAALGASHVYTDVARTVGHSIARRGWTTVYGGGRIGLMGVLADAALEAGGRVIGVMPRFLYEREVAHTNLSALELVDSFAARKARMGELSNAYLSLPGGVGTMDEMFEAWSWTQSGLENKPSLLLDASGYYEPLVAFLDRAVGQGFITPSSRATLRVGSDIEGLLDHLARVTGAARHA